MPPAVCCHNSPQRQPSESAPARRLPALICFDLITGPIAVVRVVSCRCSSVWRAALPLLLTFTLSSTLPLALCSVYTVWLWLRQARLVDWQTLWVVCCALYIAHAPWEIYMLTGSCQRRLLMYRGCTGIHWLSAVSVSLWPCVTLPDCALVCLL